MDSSRPNCLFCYSGARDRRDGQIGGSVRRFLQLRLWRMDQQASDSSEPRFLGSAEPGQRGTIGESQGITRGAGQRD